MRKSMLLTGILLGFTSSVALAQGLSTPSGSAPDIRNSDLDNHATFSNPDLHDQLVTYRQRELSDKIRAQSEGLGLARTAKASELIAGANVNDNSGTSIGKIESVDHDGVIVSTLTGKVKLPADAFGHNNAGLLLDTTKAKFEKVVAQANAAP